MYRHFKAICVLKLLLLFFFWGFFLCSVPMYYENYDWSCVIETWSLLWGYRFVVEKQVSCGETGFLCRPDVYRHFWIFCLDNTEAMSYKHLAPNIILKHVPTGSLVDVFLSLWDVSRCVCVASLEYVCPYVFINEHLFLGLFLFQSTSTACNWGISCLFSLFRMLTFW